LDEWFLNISLEKYVEPYQFSLLNIFEKIILAEKLPLYKESILNHVKDLKDIIAPNPGKFNQLFTIAMKESENYTHSGVDDILNGSTQAFPFTNNKRTFAVAGRSLPTPAMRDRIRESDKDGGKDERKPEKDISDSDSDELQNNDDEEEDVFEEEDEPEEVFENKARKETRKEAYKKPARKEADKKRAIKEEDPSDDDDADEAEEESSKK